MTTIMPDQKPVGDGSNTKRQPPTIRTLTVSPCKIRKQTPSKSRRRRPSDILVFPPPPLAENIVIVRMAQEAALLPSPRLDRNRHLLQKRTPARPRSQPLAAARKRPRILLSTKSFKWVKTDNAVWVKKRRLVLKTKRVAKMDATR